MAVAFAFLCKAGRRAQTRKESCMPKPKVEWEVLPHGPLREIDRDIQVVEGEIPTFRDG